MLASHKRLFNPPPPELGQTVCTNEYHHKTFIPAWLRQITLPRNISHACVPCGKYGWLVRLPPTLHVLCHHLPRLAGLRATYVSAHGMASLDLPYAVFVHVGHQLKILNESFTYLTWNVETNDVDARIVTDTHTPIHKTSTVTLLRMHTEG